jgi:hypothetical protein
MSNRPHTSRGSSCRLDYQLASQHGCCCRGRQGGLQQRCTLPHMNKQALGSITSSWAIHATPPGWRYRLGFHDILSLGTKALFQDILSLEVSRLWHLSPVHQSPE